MGARLKLEVGILPGRIELWGAAARFRRAPSLFSIWFRLASWMVCAFRCVLTEIDAAGGNLAMDGP